MTSKPNIYPFMRYQDAPAAIEFLCNVFGFEKHEVYEGPDGTIAHAQLNLGPGMIMLGSARVAANGEGTRDIERVEQGIYLAVDDIKSHYERAKATGAEIVRELATTDYGSEEYAAVDCEGFYWSFGTYHPVVEGA